MKVTRCWNGWFWLTLPVLFFGLSAVLDRGLVREIPPPLATSDLNGKPFAWADAAGRPVLLYFWATWCPLCGAMQNSLTSVDADHQVITVALQSGTESELRAYLQTQGLAWRVISDPAGLIGARYGLRGVPALFFIDRHGRIRFTATGYTTEIGIRVRLWLTARMA